MSIYCEVHTAQKSGARNPNLFDVRLKLKNVSNYPMTMNWTVDIPPVFRLVTPANSLTGSNELQAGTDLFVSGWVVDISNIPDTAKEIEVSRNKIIAMVDLAGEGMKDSCAAGLVVRS